MDGDGVTKSDTQTTTAKTNETISIGQNYKARGYEYGEFGFPDDGYDYYKHFRAIGGGDGGFIDTGTGLPDASAVKGSSSLFLR